MTSCRQHFIGLMFFGIDGEKSWFWGDHLEAVGKIAIFDFMDLDFWCNDLEGEHKQSDMRGGLLLRNRQPGW